MEFENVQNDRILLNRSHTATISYHHNSFETINISKQNLITKISIVASRKNSLCTIS